MARQTVLAIELVVLLVVLGSIGAWLGGAAGFGLGVAAALLLVAVIWLVERGRYRSWGYLERVDDLVVRRGLLFHRLTVVPFGRMQFIDVTAGPVDRLFDLATV